MTIMNSVPFYGTAGEASKGGMLAGCKFYMAWSEIGRSDGRKLELCDR